MVRSKKWPFRAAVGMILTVALVLVPGCGKDGQETSGTAEGSRKAEGDIVLYLDGSPVSAEEYGMLTQKFSSQITMQYTTDQVNQEDFWETEIDGETPYSRLADLVEEQLRENYVLKDLAVELDLTEDYTYGDLMDSMEQENEDRSDLSDDEISYGLSSYDAASYYQYWYSNLETRVTEAVIRQEVQVSEADCRDIMRRTRRPPLMSWVFPSCMRRSRSRIPMHGIRPDNSVRRWRAALRKRKSRRRWRCP